MNQDVKAKWVAALRSGEYTQATDALKGRDGYCCLGVLCDLYVKKYGGTMRDVASPDEELPSSEVVEWAELSSNDPRLVIDGERAYVSRHNDGYYEADKIRPKSFAEIADAIEKQL